MRKSVHTIALALCSVATHAMAQAGDVFLSWSWSEVVAGSNTPVVAPNGIVEPGEGVLLELRINYSPLFGMPLPIPGYPEATVAGFGGTVFSLDGWRQSVPALLARGEFSHQWLHPEWSLAQGNTVAGVAQILHVQVGQFAFLPGQIPNPENPIDGVWRIVWTPEFYVQDTLIFSSYATGPLHTSLYVRTGTDPTTGHPTHGLARLNASHGIALIPMVPAPGAFAVLCVAVSMLTKRRRSQ